LKTSRGYWYFCLLLLPLAIFAAFSRPWFQTSDMWETAAAIRAASQNLLHPTNPLLALPGNTSPRFTPYVIFWGGIVRYSGLNLFTVIGLAGVANFLLFVTGLARWITWQTKEGRLPLFLLITMLVVCGTGYNYAQAYQFGVFLSTLAYVGMFAYGVSFHALAALRKYMDTGLKCSLAAYTVLSVLVFVTHPVTSTFQFVAAFAMLLTVDRWKQTMLLQVVPVICLAAALLWPYFDYGTVLFKGSADKWFPAALFSQQIVRMGTALTGLILAGWFAYRRQQKFVVLGTFFCLAIYALSGAVGFLMGSRFLLYGAIFLHLAIAIYLLENWPDWWKQLALNRPRSLWKPAIVLVIFLPALWFRAAEAKHLAQDAIRMVSGAPRDITPAERFGFLAGKLTTADVVIAEDDTGWPLPAITGAKLVCQQKGDPLIQPEIERRRDDADGFFRNALTLEQRRAILNKYHVTHILADLGCLSRWDQSLSDQVQQFARSEAVHGSVTLLRVIPSNETSP
jgi:hypothetical protein